MRLFTAWVSALVFLMSWGSDVSASDPPAFLSAFAEACVPQRLSYDGTIELARSIGWQDVGESDHPELEELTATADHEVRVMVRDDPDTTLKREQFVREIGGRALYLIVTRVHTPEVITLIGCYLYDFEASEPIDPQPVSDFLGMPVGRTVEDNGFLQHTWGPNYEARPRTLDTNLSFIAEDSPHVATTGFSGLVLKFETSEPDSEQ